MPNARRTTSLSDDDLRHAAEIFAEVLASGAMRFEPSRLLSVTSAAELLDCSRGHVYGLIALGRLSAVEIKGTGTRPKTRVLASELEEFIVRSTRRADPR